jgi:PPOX class probable F420-dependent enzyme
VQLGPDEARARFAAARVARMATVREDGSPHLVPVVFAVIEDRVVHVIDAKPKSTHDSWALQRIRNVIREPRVSILTDTYDEDWSTLWWVRADGMARVVDPLVAGERWSEAVAVLAERYPQYRSAPPTGLVVESEVSRWTGWRAS